MPLYEFDLTIPPNTPQASPLRTHLPLGPGTITALAVQIPRYVAGLAHLRLLRAEHQLWPANPDSSLKGDDVVIAWAERYDLTDRPHALDALAWNDDDTYPHTLTVRVTLAEATPRTAAVSPAGFAARLRAALGI